MTTFPSCVLFSLLISFSLLLTQCTYFDTIHHAFCVYDWESERVMMCGQNELMLSLKFGRFLTISSCVSSRQRLATLLQFPSVFITIVHETKRQKGYSEVSVVLTKIELCQGCVCFECTAQRNDTIITEIISPCSPKRQAVNDKDMKVKRRHENETAKTELSECWVDLQCLAQCNNSSIIYCTPCCCPAKQVEQLRQNKNSH